MTKRKRGGPEDGDGDEDGYRLNPFPNPSTEDCPVTFLGAYEGRVVFAMPDGQIRDERAADTMRLLRTDIFRCAAGQNFLNNWRDSEDKTQREMAAVWFNRQCSEAGYWDKSRPQRSLGVWPGDGGAIILHRGPELWIIPPEPDGLIERVSIAAAMRRRSGLIYRLRAAAPEPGEASTPADGLWIRQTLGWWNFAPIGDEGLSGAEVLSGWIMCSLLGAVAPFRPHVLLHALAGSGKSTLIRFVHALISSLSGDVIDSFTPAGLANDLSGMARPVMIDEAESSAAPFGLGPIELALDLIRRMATGGGAVKKLGALAGASVTQTAVGSVLMGAVNPVVLGPADASRIAEIKLNPVTNNAGVSGQPITDADLEKAIEQAKILASRLLGRALRSAPRYLADLAVLKAAFRKQGQSPRSADLVASLAAGRCLLTRDDPLDEEAADLEVRLWSGLLAAREASDSVSNAGQDCLAHLLNWQSGQHVTDRIVSLGELVRQVAGQWPGDDVGRANHILAEFGLKIANSPDASDRGASKPWLYVANKHPALTRIFDRTIWKDWRRTLSYIDELGPAYQTRPSVKTVRFGILTQKALCIPLSPWL